MDRPRAADDFATIRARMDELSRERGRAKLSNEDVRRDASMPRGGSIRRPHQRSARGRDRCADLVKGVARPSPEVADFARQGLVVGRVVPSSWIFEMWAWSRLGDPCGGDHSFSAIEGAKLVRSPNDTSQTNRNATRYHDLSH
jgi:hypothetical protein